ncbi:MAG: deoxyribodipyrimidine photo-lyase [Pseudomonadota bacterium]
MISDPVLVWLREDLRLSDNPALRHAADTGRPVVCLYVLDDETPGPWAMGGAQRWWLHHSLRTLQEAINKIGGVLILKRGRGEEVVPEVCKELAATAVYWNRRYMSWQIEQDKGLKAALSDDGVDVESFNGRLLNEPWTIKTKTGGPYRVYTPYWKQVQTLDLEDAIPAVRKLKAPSPLPASDDLVSWNLLPTNPNWAAGFEPIWEPGEAAALRRWRAWVKTYAGRYNSERNRPDLDSTSRMAPHIHFGEISIKMMYRDVSALMADGAIDAEEGKTFLSELVWREFSYHLLFYNPDMFDLPLNKKFTEFSWENSDRYFEAWTKGMTGYPIVDAGMRQLYQEGHMHNRVRMIVGSFLVKDLLVDWRRGMAWFWDTLVCADAAANTASWQWVAGCGADAAPFFRVFNPVTQGEKFDPDGAYVRRHVPELAHVPAKHIHAPWKAPKDVLEQAGVRLGDSYPEPMVDHARMREEALSRYQAIK